MMALDDRKDSIRLLVSRLEGRSAAVFAACCASRLRLVCGEFSNACPEARLDYNELLARVWAVIEGESADYEDLLQVLEQSMPHADDSESELTLAAQNAIICLDCAVRNFAGEQEYRDLSVEYSLDALSSLVSLREAGVVDPGSGTAESDLSDALTRDPTIQQECERQERDARELAILVGQGVADFKRRGLDEAIELRSVYPRE